MALPGLSNHPKFRRLCLLLKAPRSHARGYLELLWDTAYEKGDPVIGDETDVALAADYPGDPGELVRALLTCGGQSRAGFLEETPGKPGVFQIHDLLDHAPEYVGGRARREAERKRDKVCEHCASCYRNSDPRSKYCSPSCRTLHWRDGGKPPQTGRTDVDGANGCPSTPSTPSPGGAHHRTAGGFGGGADAGANGIAPPHAGGRLTDADHGLTTVFAEPLTDVDGPSTDVDTTTSPAQPAPSPHPAQPAPGSVGVPPTPPSCAAAPREISRERDPGDHKPAGCEESVKPRAKGGKRSKGSAELPEGFAEFWDAYPRKVDRLDAIAAWKRLDPDAATRATIMESLAAWKASEQWQTPKFIKHPPRWLNQRDWESKPAAPPVAGESFIQAAWNNRQRKVWTPEELERLHPGSTLLEHFQHAWRERYGCEYVGASNDAENAADITRRLDSDQARIRDVLDRYFADESSFVVEARHGLGLLCSQLFRWTVDGPRDPDEVEVGRGTPLDVAARIMGCTEVELRKPVKDWDGPHGEFLGVYHEQYRAKYGYDYPVQADDLRHARELVAQMGDDRGVWEGTVAHYLADPDPFYAKDKHGLGMLLKQLRRHLVPRQPQTPEEQQAKWQRDRAAWLSKGYAPG